MAGKKLAPVGGGAARPAGIDAGSLPKPVLELLAEHGRAVASGTFDPDSREHWARFFEIGGRRDELPAGAVVPVLEESGGRMRPTAGSAWPSRDAAKLAAASVRERAAARSRIGRTDRVKMAEALYGGPEQAEPDGGIGYGR